MKVEEGTMGFHDLHPSSLRQAGAAVGRGGETVHGAAGVGVKRAAETASCAAAAKRFAGQPEGADGPSGVCRYHHPSTGVRGLVSKIEVEPEGRACHLYIKEFLVGEAPQAIELGEEVFVETSPTGVDGSRTHQGRLSSTPQRF